MQSSPFVWCNTTSMEFLSSVTVSRTLCKPFIYQNKQIQLLLPVFLQPSKTSRHSWWYLLRYLV